MKSAEQWSGELADPLMEISKRVEWIKSVQRDAFDAGARSAVYRIADRLAKTEQSIRDFLDKLDGRP